MYSTDTPTEERSPTVKSQSSGGVAECTRVAGLPHRVRRLVEAVAARDHLTPSSTKKLLSQSGITAEDLAPWADFDHPDADSYGRKLVFDGGWFELMVMSWTPGDMSAIHDHGYTQWGAVQLFGRAEHAIFKQVEGVLTTAERRVFEPGDVVAVGHDLIHQMGNVGEAPFLSMHLYGCYGRRGDVTADARLYDLDQGDVQLTSGGVFFALPEDAVNRREEGPRADFPTVLRFKVELLRRLLRMHGSRAAGSFRSDRERRLAAELFAPRTWEAARRELTGRRGDGVLRHQRYAEIFGQEVAAAARLQLDLVDAGLVESGLAAERRRLQELLGLDHAALADGYLDLVDDALAVAV